MPAGKTTTRPGRRRRPGTSEGFSLVELLIVLALFGLIAGMAAPGAGRWVRRSRGLAALSTIRQTFASARLEAIKRSANVVVQVSLTADKRIRLLTFEDRANDPASPLPAAEDAAAGNCVQDIGKFAGSPATDEQTLRDVSLGGGVHIWRQGAAKDDLVSGMAFDRYNNDAAISDRIVFLPSGGILPPQDPASGLPSAAGGRGLYFADGQGETFVRVTIESDVTGKARVDMYVDQSGYLSAAGVWR